MSDTQPLLPQLCKIRPEISLGNSVSNREVELYSSFVDSGCTNAAGGNGSEHGGACGRISANGDKNFHFNWVRWKGEDRLLIGVTYLELIHAGKSKDSPIIDMTQSPPVFTGPSVQVA